MLIAAQAQSQGGRTGEGKSHHPHNGSKPHFVESTMHYIIVLIENDIRLKTAQFALKGKEVMGQRQNGNSMPQGPQNPAHMANHKPEVRGTAAIFGNIRYKRCAGIID
jgi:hypothetical protein